MNRCSSTCSVLSGHFVKTFDGRMYTVNSASCSQFILVEVCKKNHLPVCFEVCRNQSLCCVLRVRLRKPVVFGLNTLLGKGIQRQNYANRGFCSLKNDLNLKPNSLLLSQPPNLTTKFINVTIHHQIMDNSSMSLYIIKLLIIHQCHYTSSNY